MPRRRSDDLPADEAAAIDQFLRELKRESPADWLTGASVPVRSPGRESGGFWSETDEDYGVGPDGPIGAACVTEHGDQVAEGR